MPGADATSRLAGWFHQWSRPLRRFLSAHGGLPEADLDDVAQEVFLRLLRYEREEVVLNPQAYLYKIAANVAAEWSIRARYSRPHRAEWLDELEAADSPEQAAQRDSAQASIQRVLDRLDSRQRTILRLQHFEGMGYVEIAARLGVTPRVVKRSMIKCYERLRTEFGAELMGAFSDGRE